MPLLVIVVGIILVVLNYLALKKEDTNFSSVLKKSNDEFTEEKFELGRLRLEMGETITDLQREIERLKEELNGYKVSENVNENEIKEDIKEVETNTEDVISEINFNNIEKDKDNKTNKIRDLINEGLTDDEICNRLSLGKGEVLLVRSLYRN